MASSIPCSSTTRPRKIKSVVLMKELTTLRDQGKKLKVEFDSDGEPIEKIGAKYTSYVGLLGRSKVLITICTWKHVGEELKLKIWDEVLSVFDIPKTKYQQVIKIANTTWTNFKSKLTAVYVYQKPPKGRKLPVETDPVKKYPYIKSEVWKEFKESRLSEEFKAISKVAAERQSKNKYPHRMSRGGYRKAKQKLEEKLKAKLKIKEQEKEKGTGIDDSAEESSQTPTIIKRGDLWIEGRVGNDGACINSETEKIVEELEVLKEKVKKGEFVPSGKVDELTKALGTAEHYGRVRGVGGRVGHKQYFGRCKRTRDESTTVISPEFLEKLTKQITEQVRSEVYKDFEKMMGEKQTNGNVSYSVHNEKDAAEVEMNCTMGMLVIIFRSI
ncbi:uncharacterized protein LOC141630659 [Silene latifolia]|uniref:uncharacterized protein LOC141630659 n=1 Tax=Silene latifolia TaxID=37657 RepID=UPI003D77BFBC